MSGQYYDKETDTWYNLNRDYDAKAGRYIQSDSLGTIDGPNTYIYVGNDPVNKIDPSGEISYLVSRPLNLPVKANHNFIVSHAKYLGDPSATVHSFGDTGNDTMGRVTADTEGFSKGTFQTDTSAWQSLSGDESTTTFRRIDASDSEVGGLAAGVVEGKEYSAVPGLQGGVNSNSAAVAKAADGRATSVDNGRAQPGSKQANKVPIMHIFVHKDKTH